MTGQIVLRDVARIILPFSIFIGLFSQGAVSAAGLALGVLCIWYEIKRARRKQALSPSRFEDA